MTSGGAAITPGHGSGLPGAVKLVVRTFLEEQHYRQLNRVLSEQWSALHSLSAAVRLMEAHGVPISEEEERVLASLPEDRMIDALVQRMPQQSREQFEHFFLQLSLIASTTTRVRMSLEQGDREAVDDVLESAENVGILGYILKQAVAQAGNEVRMKEQAHDEWLADTESRMAPLLQSQAQSMVSQKALAQATAQLGAYRVEASEKSRKVLLGLVGGNNRALVTSVFLNWCDVVRKMKREAEIRKEYEEEINAANQALQEFKAKQLTSIKHVLARATSSTKTGLISACYYALKQEVADDKADKEAAIEAAKLDEKLKVYSDSSRGNAKSVLARMNAANQESLLGMVWKHWTAFIEDYRSNKDLEDKVKAAEQKVNDMKKRQKDGAQSVLTKMSKGTDSSLVQSVFAEWKEVYEEEKRKIEMDEAVAEKAGKMGSFAKRNKGSAMHEMERMMRVMEDSLLLIVFHQWKRDTKVDRMRRFGKEKNEKRKKQLIDVKGLFKNFATELETGLQQGTPRIDSAKLKPHRQQQLAS